MNLETVMTKGQPEVLMDLKTSSTLQPYIEERSHFYFHIMSTKLTSQVLGVEPRQSTNQQCNE